MFHLQNELTIFIVRLNNLIIIQDFKSKNELKINPLNICQRTNNIMLANSRKNQHFYEVAGFVYIIFIKK